MCTCVFFPSSLPFLPSSLPPFLPSRSSVLPNFSFLKIANLIGKLEVTSTFHHTYFISPSPTHTRTHAHTQANPDAHTCTHMHTQMHSCSHTHAHTHIHFFSPQLLKVSSRYYYSLSLNTSADARNKDVLLHINITTISSPHSLIQ